MADKSQARITDEGVARLRRRIGVPEPHPQPPHYECPNEDAFRIYAHAIGDDNPLWCDPQYAARTRWGGVIAPPAMVGGDTLVGIDEVDRHLPGRVRRFVLVASALVLGHRLVLELRVEELPG